MRKILVSECLCGERIVRYDGGGVSEPHPLLRKWKAEGRLVPICPEVFGGLPVPRPEAQRVGGRVVTRQGRDVTAAYVKGAREALRLARAHQIAFAVMKQNSPSCGSKTIHDGAFTGNKKAGEGVAVEYLRQAGFLVFGEEDIDQADAYLRRLEAPTKS